MAIKAIARKRGDWVDVRVLSKHVMESGLRKNKKTGKIVPAHYIETLTAKSGGKEIFRVYLGSSASKNPLVRFYAKGNKGDKLEFEWKDNKGKTDQGKTTVK